MIDIPPRLASRPRDKRGYPIPFVQFVASDGTPDFRTLDAAKLERALAFRLCGLCGVRMGRHIFFVGGPKCVEHGVFYDPPLDRACAVYSLRACPHLARSKGRYSEPTAPRGLDDVRFVVGDMDTTKSAWFGLMHATAYTFEPSRGGMTVIRARLPWIDVERWKDGAKIISDT